MSKNKAGIVAIVGRANVGKSSLFNAVLHRREAIIANEPGTTRDSLTAKASYHDRDFWLVDTAGLKTAEDDFELTIQEQITQAAESADVILVVVEAAVGITEEDRRVAKLALKTGKPVALLINKADQAKKADLSIFERLGIKQRFETSAIHLTGVAEALDFVIDNIPRADIKEADDRLHLAILGRPNVGKSALFNTLAKKQQAIVADRAGTTRDVNRTIVRYNGQEIELMDTAGIRRSGRIERGVEHFSVLRSLRAIEDSDVCLVVMDGNEYATALDQKIAGMVKEAGKGLIICISKWDSVEKDPYTAVALTKTVKDSFSFVPFAPLILTSSVSGQNVSKIFELALNIMQTRRTEIATAKLNTWLRLMIDRHLPAGLKNSRPKLNYITQLKDQSVPTFKIFGAHTELLHWSYKRYLEREMREAFGFDGTAIKMIYTEKHEDKAKTIGKDWKKHLRADQLPKRMQKP